MTNDIAKLISENKAFYKSIDEINQAYNIFRQSVNDKFWKEIREKKPSKLICQTEDGIDIKYVIEEDGEGFYFGFYLEKEGIKIEGIDERVKHLAIIFKVINHSFNTNENYIGWTFSNTFRKFWWLDKEKIFDLNNDKEMNNFTNEIINELNNYIYQIKERIK